MTHVVFRSFIPVAPEELFEFHADVRNLAAISPAVPPFRLESEPSPTREGDVQVFRLGWRLVGVRWVARISCVVPGRLAEDVQVEGPFRSWRHQHRFLPAPGGSWLEDRVAFRLLPTPVGAFLEWLLVRPALAAMFWWRHRRTRTLLTNHAKS